MKEKYVPCESCNKKFEKISLMRHISQSKDCKSYYGPNFDEEKKVNNRNKF